MYKTSENDIFSNAYGYESTYIRLRRDVTYGYDRSHNRSKIFFDTVMNLSTTVDNVPRYSM